LADDKPLKKRGHTRLLQPPKLPFQQLKTRTKRTRFPHDPIQLCHQFYEVKIAAYERKNRPRPGET
jgi:hypothetical protein